METNARFKITNGRITRLKELPNVAFLTVMCEAGKFPQRFDVAAFEAPPFQLEEGLAVTISGELSMRKPKDGVGPWQLQLIARRIELGDDAKAPRPRQSEDTPNRAAKPRTARSSEPVAVNDDSDVPF